MSPTAQALLPHSVMMVRRICALLTMIAIIGLLLVLVWQVQLHHERGVGTDEPAIVALASRPA